MKSIFHFVLIMLTVVVLSACAAAKPESGDDMIDPGDTIGEFLITTSDDDSVIYTTTIHCPFDPNTLTETCEIETGRKVNVGLGVFGKTVEELDTFWAEQTYQMTIEGRPVNLEAFGSVEITHPIVGKMRLWNVVIVTDSPGEITIQHSGEMAGESMEGTNVLIYIKP